MSERRAKPQFKLWELLWIVLVCGIYLAIWKFIDPSGGNILAVGASGVVMILLMIWGFSMGRPGH